MTIPAHKLASQGRSGSGQHITMETTARSVVDQHRGAASSASSRPPLGFYAALFIGAFVTGFSIVGGFQ